MIEVRLSPDLVEKWGNDLHVANFVCKRFVDMGVAMFGCFVPRPLTGRIVSYIDDVFGDHVWEWHEQ